MPIRFQGKNYQYDDHLFSCIVDSLGKNEHNTSSWTFTKRGSGRDYEYNNNYYLLLYNS